MKKENLPEPNPLPLGWIGGMRGRGCKPCKWWDKHWESIRKGAANLASGGATLGVCKKREQGAANPASMVGQTLGVYMKRGSKPCQWWDKHRESI